MSDASPGRDSASQLPLPLEPQMHEAHRARAMFFLGAAVAFQGITMAMQMGLNANFLATDMKLEGYQLGLLEAARESCGVIALGVLALLAGFAEPLVALAMLLLLGIGLSAYSVVSTFETLVLTSLVWSLGLHVWMPLPNSITLALAERGREGYRLGQTQAAGAAGFGAGLVLALGLTLARVPMRPLYILAGAAAVLAALACLAIPRDIKTPGPRLVFKRKYGLYYLLCFLEGWRKQISICFAGFLLVREFHTSVAMMLALQIVVQAAGYFASKPVGALIDRIGERRILTFYYTSLVMFFVGYAFLPWRPVLWALFIVDSAFFVFAMSLTTYVGRMAPRSELTPTLSMGVAMNHVAAVTMPFVGGMLWSAFGYRYAFLVGAAAAALSIPAAMRVPRKQTRDAPGPTPRRLT